MLKLSRLSNGRFQMELFDTAKQRLALVENVDQDTARSFLVGNSYDEDGVWVALEALTVGTTYTAIFGSDKQLRVLRGEGEPGV